MESYEAKEFKEINLKKSATSVASMQAEAEDGRTT
jgi:hypothetical protein